jgi:uncharacterized protein (DUF885 family)
MAAQSGLKAAFLVLILLASSAASRADTLKALVADYDRFDLSTDPIEAGQQGDGAALKRWPDSSAAEIARQKAALQGFMKRLNALSTHGMSDEDRLNRDFLKDVVQPRLEELSFDTERMPFAAEDGFEYVPDYVARSTVIRNRAEADAWLGRLAALPGFYATNIANARRGLATGFVQPALVVEAALGVARNLADATPEASSLLLPFEKLPDAIPASEQHTLRERALALVRDLVKPAQRSFVSFLETEYAPHARPQLGIRSVPDGERLYPFLVRRYTTTELNPDQVHELGQAEVRRIRAEMEQIIAEVGFKGSFPEFLAYLRHDPKFYATERQVLLEKASEIAKRIDDQLPRWFATLPRLPYGVRPVPADIEESYTTARYWEGSPERGTAGGYMVNTSHLDQRPLYELPALTLHEAVPGHHLQIALSQENARLSHFRKSAYLVAFVEGWALYSEKLGREMGVYRDPYERFGQLSMEMWRACRLLVDTGLHWKGWTRDQARACFTENSALSEKNIDVEVDRYIGWPGQALGYKIGEIRIWELRRHAEAELGAKFDIRRFHDLVLGNGPLPLDLLASEVDRWIALERNR